MRTIVTCLALLAAPVSQAAFVTYEYRGAGYDYIAVEQPSADESYTFDNPWLARTQNYVSGWITIDTSKLPGGSLANLDFDQQAVGDQAECETPGCNGTAIHAWQFFDGVRLNGLPGGTEFFIGHMFRFTTDANGNFTSWFVDLYGDPEGLLLSSTFGDFRTNYPCTDVEGDLLCARSTVAGTWTRQVPEPGALALALAALAGLWGVRRREAVAAVWRS